MDVIQRRQAADAGEIFVEQGMDSVHCAGVPYPARGRAGGTEGDQLAAGEQRLGAVAAAAIGETQAKDAFQITLHHRGRRVQPERIDQGENIGVAQQRPLGHHIPGGMEILARHFARLEAGIEAHAIQVTADHAVAQTFGGPGIGRRHRGGEAVLPGVREDDGVFHGRDLSMVGAGQLCARSMSLPGRSLNWPSPEGAFHNVHQGRSNGDRCRMSSNSAGQNAPAVKNAKFLWFVRDLRTLFFVEGIVMIGFGVVAMALPPIAGLVIAILLGWLLLIGGLIGVATTLAARHAPGFWWSLLSALTSVVAGGLLFAWPLGGLISLTFALAAYLLLDGALSIAIALEHRRHLTPKWTWLLFNGVADLVFSGIIVMWLPGSAVWALGLIVGIDMLIGGATQVAMAIDLDYAAGEPRPAR
jgi:uncharacterized membrane protein HdeD (DUF308 family)